MTATQRALAISAQTAASCDHVHPVPDRPCDRCWTIIVASVQALGHDAVIELANPNAERVPV
jgi:hypothetical protein